VRDVVLAVITRLKADTSVAAVVSTRVYRKKLPVSPTFPAITVDRVDKARDADTNTGRYGHMRVQCTAWSSTIGPEENLSELIADSLHRCKNSILTAGTSTVYVVSIRDAGGMPDSNDEIPLYMEHRDFTVHYDYHK
jgi:hypothetical protein